MSRAQVYSLDPHYGRAALSGTAEMAIGDYFVNRTVDPAELPLRLAAVSRCYRAETSKVKKEEGRYRVHMFTKEEMLGVTASGESGAVLAFVRGVERELCDRLELTYRVLDMCRTELGSPANRKYDIEAWMTGRQGGGGRLFKQPIATVMKKVTMTSDLVKVAAGVVARLTSGKADLDMGDKRVATLPTDEVNDMEEPANEWMDITHGFVNNETMAKISDDELARFTDEIRRPNWNLGKAVLRIKEIFVYFKVYFEIIYVRSSNSKHIEFAHLL